MKRRHLSLITIAVALVGAVLATETASRAAAAASSKPDPSRYPYDPACEWGRLADGRGMLVRCLTRAEAQALMGQQPAIPAQADAAQGETSAKSAQESASAPDTAPEQPGTTMKFKASVQPAVADTGKLPQAHTKLASARNRFEDCVRQNGGLSDRTGEVHVRFLVRERGRAEGVSVAKRRGLTEKAARCVADVVDRRSVGIPDEPIVGATVVVNFTAESE